MFIPYTKGSELKSKLQEMESTLQLSHKWRYVEEAGSTIGSKLVTQDPWKLSCGRPACMTCTEQPGKCSKKGICYQFTCMTCKENGKEMHYWGESYRSMWDRLQEHLAALRGKNRESPLYEHQEDVHGGEEEPNFKLKILGFFKKPLQRQTMEGLLIGGAEEGSYMNRRGEWGQNLPPKLEVTDPDDDWRPNSNHNPEKVKRKARGQGPSQGKVKVSQEEPSQVKKREE